ncbi:MAG: hypothetical protein HKM07_03560 [Chlamydiae bacterium]|nr:hypothetical protein [Chlamydiota bacterium]
MKRLLSLLLWLTWAVSYAMEDTDLMKRFPSESSYLQELLSVTQLEWNGTLDSLVSTTQKKWLRLPKQERWHLTETRVLDDVEKIYALMEKMGFFREISTKELYFDHAVVLGGAFFRVQNRMNFLADLWKRGMRFRELIFLTGERPLDPEIEPQTNFTHSQGIPQNEAEMMLYVHRYLDAPREMKELPLRVISVPFDKINGKRPTRADTIRAWLEGSPNLGKCLFVSNQPYCMYDTLVIRNNFPKSLSFEMVGSAADHLDVNTNVLLDNLARCLYEELQLKRKV